MNNNEFINKTKIILTKLEDMFSLEAFKSMCSFYLDENTTVRIDKLQETVTIDIELVQLPITDLTKAQAFKTIEEQIDIGFINISHGIDLNNLIISYIYYFGINADLDQNIQEFSENITFITNLIKLISERISLSTDTSSEGVNLEQMKKLINDCFSDNPEDDSEENNNDN